LPRPIPGVPMPRYFSKGLFVRMLVSLRYRGLLLGRRSTMCRHPPKDSQP
jgi:hypothetical protein